MKILFTRARLLAVLLLFAVAFAKTYQDAHNKGDRPRLMTLFADYVGWVNADGSVRPNTKTDVDADYVRDFGETAGSYMDFTVFSTEAQPDGKMKIGTTVSGYDFLRKTNAKLNPTSSPQTSVTFTPSRKILSLGVKVILFTSKLIA